MRTSSDRSGEIAIRAEGLSKQYRMAGARRHDTLRDVLSASVRALAGAGRGGRAPRETFWALDDVSFEVRQGENIGILGLNGAGKSTLLKVLSRVTDPSRGRARINGRLGSLLEVGTGFHPELTGRENIFLYGAILGMPQAEIARKFEAIVAFSEIAEFIDTPVKRYSSGMYVRLAFSVAAHLEPDILLLDEVLSVGDLPFQRKCIEFAKGLQKRDATILLVSHNMLNIKAMCDRVIYLRRGRVQFDGPAAEGIELYEADSRLTAAPFGRGAGITDPARCPIVITDMTLMDEAGRPASVFDHGQRLRLRLDYEVRGAVDAPNFIVVFVRCDDLACCNYSTELDAVRVGASPGPGRIELVTPPLRLVAERYRILVLVREKGFRELVCAQVGDSFQVRHPVLDTSFGAFYEAGEWTSLDKAPPPAPSPEAVSPHAHAVTASQP